jgi:hypothetical protein
VRLNRLSNDDRKWNERSTLGYTVRSIYDYQNRNDECEAKKEGVRSISAVTRYSVLLAEFVWKSAHRRSKATIMDTMTYASFAVISTSVARDNQQRQIVPEPEFSSFDMSCIQALLAQ